MLKQKPVLKKKTPTKTLIVQKEALTLKERNALAAKERDEKIRAWKQEQVLKRRPAGLAQQSQNKKYAGLAKSLFGRIRAQTDEITQEQSQRNRGEKVDTTDVYYKLRRFGWQSCAEDNSLIFISKIRCADPYKFRFDLESRTLSYLSDPPKAGFLARDEGDEWF